MPGPPPKRDSERRRKNAKTIPTSTVDIAALTARPVEIPDCDASWEGITRQWWNSLARSGQSVFWEPSDWSTAYLLAEAMDRELKPQPVVTRTGEDVSVEMMTLPIKGASLTALLKGFSALMVTEGDRRRLSIELERRRDAESLPEGVTSISQTRAARVNRASGTN